MPISDRCDTGKAEVNFQDDREQSAYEYLVEYYDGDQDQAYTKFTEIFRSTENDYLRDNLSTKVIPDFKPHQQREVIKTLKSIVFHSLEGDKIHKNGKPNINLAEEYAKNQIGALKKHFKNNDNDQTSYREVKTANILNNWDDFWEMTMESLEKSGIETDQNGYIKDTSGIDATRKNWEDKARFMIDSKDTASAKVKSVLSIVPKVQFSRDENGRIRREDGTPVIEKSENFLGLNTYAEMDSIFDKVSEILSDFVTGNNVQDTYQEYIDHLREIGQNNPQMLEVVRHLESMGDDIEFQSDFVNTFGKSYTRQEMALLSPIYSSGKGSNQIGWNLNIFDSNRTSQTESIKSEWFENQKLLPIVQKDEDSQFEIDQSEIESIKSDYISEMRQHLNQDGTVTDRESIEIVQDTLESLGIDVRYETLEHISQNPSELGDFDTWKQHISPNSIDGRGASGLMDFIFEGFEKTKKDTEEDTEEYGKLGLNNPIKGRDSQGIINNLAKVESNFRPRVYSPSFNDIKGDQIYAMQQHTALTRVFNKLKENPEDVLENQGVYNRKSSILKALAQDRGNSRDYLDVTYVDGLNRVNRGEGNTHQNMSTSEKELMRLAFFQNPQRNNRVKFLSPTLSDKSRDYVVTLPQIHQMMGDAGDNHWVPDGDASVIRENGSLELDSNGLEAHVLYNMALSEINRILNIQNQMRQGLSPENHPFGEDYMWEGQFFYHFPELNPEQLGENRDKLWVEEMYNGNQIYRLKDPQTNREAERFIQDVLTDKLEQKVQQTRQRWIDQDIVPDQTDYTTWMMDDQYIREQIPYNLNEEAKALTYAALDYQLSNRFFNTEIRKILAGDPALHVDQQRNPREQPDTESRTEDIETIEATLINLEKRSANHIAPALTQNIGKHENNSDREDTSTVKIATLTDRYTTSEFIDQYEDMFRSMGNESLADFYRGIETSDAQEYTTLREFVRTQLLNGEISKDLHDKIVDKIDEVQNDSNNSTNYFSLTKLLSEEEIEHVFMPHKDIIVGSKYHQNLDTTAWIYRKTSSIPLIPEVTRGTDLDNLRRAMEGDQLGESRVNRVAYQSADKTGAYNTIGEEIYNNDDQVTFKDASEIEDIFVTEKDVRDPETNADRMDLNVQTISREHLGLQFQIPKKDDRTVSRGTQMDKLLTQNAKDIKGFDVPWKDDTVSGQEIENMKQKKISKIYELGRQKLLNEFDAEIKDEGGDNERIVFNDLETLRETLQREAEERDWGPAAIDSIQLDDDGEFILPLSFSPASSRIESLLLSLVKSRTIGQKMPGKSYVQVSSAGFHGIAKDSKIYGTDALDRERGLQHAHIDEETGEVQPAQVLVTWDFRDEDGNLLDIEEYTDENGNIDDDKLDPELRKLIGHRIPTQGASSMLPIEVAGFLPYSQYKTMVVTDEIVAQMGSDFDVDKVYSYQDEYTVEEDGTTLRRSGINDNGFDRIDELKQEYKDLHWSTLTNPEFLGHVLKPLDMPYLSNEADRIEELKTDQDEITDHLDPHQQVENHNSQHAGKALIGITSLASNFQSMLEMYPQPMTAPDPSQEGANKVERNVKIETEDGVRRLNTVGDHGIETQMPDGSKSPLSDAIMMYQNGAVDNAKELILDKLNATTNTAETIMATLMMHDGDETMSLDQSSRFFAQEVIDMWDKEVDKLQGVTNDEYFDDPVEDVAAERIKEEILSNFSEEDVEWIESRVEEFIRSNDQEHTNARIPDVSRLTDDLAKANTGAINSDRQYAANQLAYLESFLGLKEIADALTSVRSVVNFGDRTSVSPGKTLLHAKNKVDDYKNIADNEVFQNAKSIVEGNNNEWKSAAENSFKLAWEVFGRSEDNNNTLFHYDSPIFENVKEELEDITGSQIRRDDAVDLFREMKSFVFSSNQIFENPEGERQKLLKGTENVKDIATRVKEAQDEQWGKESFFLQKLEARLPDGEEDIGTVLFKADKGDRTDELRIIQDLAGLLSSKKAERRLLAEDLVKYSFLVSGGVQTPTSFTSYVPMGYLTQELGLKEAINGFDFNDHVGEKQKRFKEQYFQHNPSDAEVVDETNVDDLRKQGELPVKIKTFDNEDFYRVDSRGNKNEIKFVSIYDQREGKWRLYQYGEDGNHYEIDTLGKANKDGYNTVEYNVNEDKRYNSSQIETNKTDLKFNPFSTENESRADQIEENGSNDEADRISKLVENESEIEADEFYQSVRDNENDPYVSKLTKFMEKIDDEFTIRMAPQDSFGTNVDAHYTLDSPNVLWLSNDITDRYDDTKITRAVLHELIHKKTLEIRSKRPQNRTKNQNKLLSRLNGIFKSIIENGNPPDKVEKLLTGRGGDLRLEEFLSYGIANQTVLQEYLKKKKVGDKSRFQQIVDILSDLIKSISRNLGIEVESDSALARTIDNTLALFEETKAVKDNVGTVEKDRTPSDLESESDEGDDISTFSDMQENIEDQMDTQGNNQDLEQSVGEFRRGLDGENKKKFDQIRNRIITEC